MEQYPFPLLQTDTKLAADPSLAGWNASISATTEFFLVWRADSSCGLRVVHERASAKLAAKRAHALDATNRSQVKVTSLAIRRASLGSVAKMHADSRAGEHKRAVRSAVRCSAGYRLTWGRSQ